MDFKSILKSADALADAETGKRRCLSHTYSSNSFGVCGWCKKTNNEMNKTNTCHMPHIWIIGDPIINVGWVGWLMTNIGFHRTVLLTPIVMESLSQGKPRQRRSTDAIKLLGSICICWHGPITYHIQKLHFKKLSKPHRLRWWFLDQ